MPYLRAGDPHFVDATPEFLPPLQDAYFCLGDPDAPTTPVGAVLSMPHHVLPRHAQVCVLQGTLDVGELVLTPGDVTTTAPHELCGPHAAGPEGCTTLEIFSTITGCGEVVYDTTDGPFAVRYLEETRNRE